MGKKVKEEMNSIRSVLKRSPVKSLTSRDYLSTGSTLLNLACSGMGGGGFGKGCFYFMVGDSASGKTFLALTCFAESRVNPEFKDYRLIFDNAENGALMDIGRFFGQAVAESMEPPAGTIDDPKYSTTVEQFYDNVAAAAREDRPFVYILDSMDALTCEAEEEHAQKKRAARAKGKEVGGSYGTDKAKVNSSGMRLAIADLRRTGSILIVISQTRDNIGFGAQFNPKTRGGGHALTFYATLELWTSLREKMKRTVRGKPREVGIVSKVRVKKNRQTGKDRTVLVPILHSYGLDDVGSCVDYLVEEGYWKESKGRIVAPELDDFAGTREALVAEVIERDWERDLKKVVTGVWDEIETEAAVHRVVRYPRG